MSKVSVPGVSSTNALENEAYIIILIHRLIQKSMDNNERVFFVILGQETNCPF